MIGSITRELDAQEETLQRYRVHRCSPASLCLFKPRFVAWMGKRFAAIRNRARRATAEGKAGRCGDSRKKKSTTGQTHVLRQRDTPHSDSCEHHHNP